MRKFLFLFVLCLIFVPGCTNESETDYPNSLENDGLPVEVVIQERDPNYPLYEYVSSTDNTRTATSHEDYLGYSLNFNYYPLDDVENMGSPVIDAEKYITAKGINPRGPNIMKYSQSYFAFSDFSRYEEKSQIETKIGSTFDLKLGLFSAGAEVNYKSAFGASFTQEESSVYGNLTIDYRYVKYSLYLTSNNNKIIRQEGFLCKNFKDDLYHLTAQELVSTYGPFVVGAFNTGARLEALYVANDQTSTSTFTKETNLEAAIKANYGLSGGSLSVGVKKSDSLSTTDKFSSISMTLRTLGGAPTYPTFSAPSAQPGSVFDLSGWVSSLSNTANHTIVNFEEGSLYLLTDFVMESNLISNLNKFMVSYDPHKSYTSSKLPEPYISIYEVSEGRYTVSLMTRHNTQITLEAWSPESTAQLESSTNLLKTKYKIKIVKKYISILPPIDLPKVDPPSGDQPISPDPGLPITTPDPGTGTDNPAPTTFFSLNKENLSKFSYDGATYILDEYNKTAYTIYDKYVLDAYIFDDLVNSIPVKTGVDINTLVRDYRLIAL